MIFQDPQPVITFGIPAVVFSGLFSGLIVALVSGFTVWRQNKSNERRQTELLDSQLKQQDLRLAHEADQKRIEREMVLRRDIYLAGIAAVGKMYDFLLSFSNVNLNEADRSKILDNVGESLSKVFVIANLETLIALDKVDTFYKRNFTFLMEKRMELDNNIQQKVSLENYRANALQKNLIFINDLNTAAKELNKSQYDFTNTLFINNQKDVEEFNNQIENLKHTTIEQIKELLGSCLETVNEFQIIANDAVLCVRRELNFPIDEEKYKTLVNKSNSENIAHVKKFYKDIIEKHRHEL